MTKIAKITGVIFTAFAFILCSNTAVFASVKHHHKKHTRSHVNKKNVKRWAGVIHPIQLRKTKENAQLLCLADNIYFEGRSESTSGQIAIGYATLNRVGNGSYPDTICEVVKQRGQFSWYKKHKRYVVEDEEAWNKALILAQGIKSGTIPNRYKGITSFHATYVRPHWKDKRLASVIGNHKFYYDRRKG